MKDKKEEQAKKWRDLRKRQNRCAKNILNFQDKEKGKDWVDGFEPLTEEDQRWLAVFLQDAYENCCKDHFAELKKLGKEYQSGKDQSSIGSLEKSCYMAMGRETMYELLLAVLCPKAVERDYRAYAIKTAKEWKERSDDAKA